MLDELRDIVQGKSGFEITEIAGRYLEGRRRAHALMLHRDIMM